MAVQLVHLFGYWSIERLDYDELPRVSVDLPNERQSLNDRGKYSMVPEVTSVFFAAENEVVDLV